MARLFVALSVPDMVADQIALIQCGVPSARWQTRDQLHLTLRFIGEVDGREMAIIHDVLLAIRSRSFSLELFGIGQFGNKHPHALWAAARDNDDLRHLQRKIESALGRAGIAGDRQKFVPHVTVARLRGPPQDRVVNYLRDHALFSSPVFSVDEFILYSSLLTGAGSVYRQEHSYALG